MPHYSLAQRPKLLLKWAEAMAIEIAMKDISHPVLVYRGMSGVAAATALSLQLHVINVQHYMVYVRKERERLETHGSPIEREQEDSYGSNCTFIFVDDFVSSGETMRKSAYALCDFTDLPCFSYAALQYSSEFNDTFNLKLLPVVDGRVNH